MFDFLKNLFGGADITEKLKEGAFLVDVRSPQEFDAGHVNGSVNIPLDRIPNSLDKFKGKKNIIVFCRSGNRSSQAKSILERNGFTNVTNGGTWQSVNEKLISL
ncbi:MAG: rhodanese-like domain-containing protein [Chitinophagales bacterium]|jgi:phage shock protein E|nr:rhodanese-like domain-containing protein [Sphingobacteriales bacterium]